MEPFFQWVQTSRIAQTIAQSALLTGLLSGAHLLGLTMVVGGALVSGLRLLGLTFRERPVQDATDGIGRVMTLGLTLSVTTGVLLVASRLSEAVANDIFQLKMGLLGAAMTFFFTVHRRVLQGTPAGPLVVRATGAVTVALWLGVALAGCAFILLE